MSTLPDAIEDALDEADLDTLEQFARDGPRYDRARDELVLAVERHAGHTVDWTDVTGDLSWRAWRRIPFDNGDQWIWCPWCKTWLAEDTSEMPEGEDPRGVDGSPGWSAAYYHAYRHADIAPTAHEVEETYVLAPRYAPGAPVQDADEHPRDRGTMRVLGLSGPKNADEVTFGSGRKQTIASVNEDHPKKAPVYTCIFEGYLDSHVPDWESMLGEPHEHRDFPRRLGEFAKEYGIPRKTYDYPATRLAPRPTCSTCDERLDWNEGHSMYLCHNPDCADGKEEW